MTYSALPAARPAPWRQRCITAATVASLSLHLLGLFIALPFAVHPDAAPAPLTLTVRRREAVPPAEPIIASPPAPIVLGVPPRKASTARPAVLATGNAQPAASPTVPTAQPGTIEPLPETPQASPAPFSAPRLATDYLNNPEPAYPATSRRLGEQGKVVLLVRVSAWGSALAAEISQSSGFARLDEAAIAAVEGWRFVPARLGSEAIESTVLVPLRFSLDN